MDVCLRFCVVLSCVGRGLGIRKKRKKKKKKKKKKNPLLRSATLKTIS